MKTTETSEGHGAIVREGNTIVTPKVLITEKMKELDLNTNKPGLICFWTLKNPSYPERIIRNSSRVTCCKFSK